MHAEGSVADLRALPFDDQVRACEQRLGHRPPDLPRVHADVDRALTALGPRTALEALQDLGITITRSTDDPSVGTTTFRALLDLPARRLTLYCALDLEPVVVAHETFHALCPKVTGRHAEVAANVFATRVTALPYYAGLLDLEHRPARSTRE